MSDLKDTLDQIGSAFKKFRGENDEKINGMSEQLNALDTVVGRLIIPGGGSSYATGGGRMSTGAENEHKEKFMAWARQGTDPDGLKTIEASMSTLSDPDGGYLVPVEVDKNIEKLALASVAMRRIATIKTSKGEYKRPLSKGGTDGGWVGEKENRSETDTPELAIFAPPMCEIYANPKTTQKLLDMSEFDIAGWFTDEINNVFIEKEGTGFISGDGVGRVHGIIDESKMVADASWAFGKTGFITGGHATLINNADALIDLQHALKPIYRQNGTFLMNDNTLSVVRRLKDGDGNYIWMPGLMENSPDILLGKPIEIDDNMPDIGADAFPICFGDFKRAYTIVDHTSGIRMLRDPYSEKGFVSFYTTKRLAGGISNAQALKFLKIST